MSEIPSKESRARAREFLDMAPSDEDETNLALIFDAARHAIADRVRSVKIVRLEVGVPPLQQIQEVIDGIADDIDDGWKDYE